MFENFQKFEVPLEEKFETHQKVTPWLVLWFWKIKGYVNGPGCIKDAFRHRVS